MAEVIYNNIKGEKSAISRGISVFSGSGASLNSKKAVLKYGLNIENHISKQITYDDIESAHLVITMTMAHKYILQNAFPQFSEKIITLSEFAGETDDVTDPFGGNESVYEETAQMIYDYIVKGIGKIRLAKNKDAEEIFLLEKEIFPDFWSKKTIEEKIEKESVLIFEKKGKTLGYCIFMCAADEGEILKIAVDVAHRKDGIGNALLKETLKKLYSLGAKNVFLEVRRSNINAISLYEKSGFKKMGERKNYYPDGEDALILIKER